MPTFGVYYLLTQHKASPPQRNVLPDMLSKLLVNPERGHEPCYAPKDSKLFFLYGSRSRKLVMPWRAKILMIALARRRVSDASCRNAYVSIGCTACCQMAVVHIIVSPLTRRSKHFITWDGFCSTSFASRSITA